MREKTSIQQSKLLQVKEHEASMLLAERNTWALLQDLEKDRRLPNMDTELTETFVQKFSLSDKVVLNNLVVKDRGLRQNLVKCEFEEQLN